MVLTDSGSYTYTVTATDAGSLAKDPSDVSASVSLIVVSPDLLTDSDNNGSINAASDDPSADPTFEETAPGKMVISGGNRAELRLNGIPSGGVGTGWVMELAAIQGSNNVTVWTAETGGTQVELPATYASGTSVPGSLWVRGEHSGFATLQLALKNVSTGQLRCPDKVIFSVKDQYSYSYSAPTSSCYTVVNPNWTKTTYCYDERQRLKEVEHQRLDGSPATYVDFSQVDYILDGVGNRKEAWFDGDSSYKKHLFGYDENNRLISANYGSYYSHLSDISWTYDWVGNRDPSAGKYDAADRLLPASWLYWATGSLKHSTATLHDYDYDPRELLSTVGY